MPTHAKFTTVWTITWPEFENIRHEKMSKIIFPSYKNVVFRFRVELGGFIEVNDAQKFGISVVYEDGPLCSLDDCTIWWYDLRNDTNGDTTRVKSNGISYQPVRGEHKHWPNFEDKDINELKKKYGLDDDDELLYSITIAIPLTAFSGTFPKPEIQQRPGWLKGIFECLEDAEKVDFSDVRFIAGDGGTFYCHRNVVGEQSKALKTMLKNPISGGEKSGSFSFPSLDTGSLNAVLKYLYSGECGLMELPAPLIIQVADFSEQYGLQVLKDACIGRLWEIVVENPKDAIEIIRFADLHSDAKYLKDRAMNVIMENFVKSSLKVSDFFGGNDNDLQGNRLREEYVLYTMHRVGVCGLGEEEEVEEPME